MNAIYGNQTAPEPVKQLDVYAGLSELTMAVAAVEEHISTLSGRLSPVMCVSKTDGKDSGIAPHPIRSTIGNDLITLAGRVYGVRRQVLDMLDALQV